METELTFDNNIDNRDLNKDLTMYYININDIQYISPCYSSVKYQYGFNFATKYRQYQIMGSYLSDASWLALDMALNAIRNKLLEAVEKPSSLNIPFYLNYSDIQYTWIELDDINTHKEGLLTVKIW